MKQIIISLLVILAFSSVYAQNSGSERKRMDNDPKRFQALVDSLTKPDDLNNESDHLYYYYSTNAGCYNVEPLDYKTSTVTLLPKSTLPWSYENSYLSNLTTGVGSGTGESQFDFSVHSQKWEHIIGLVGRNEFTMDILEHYDGGYLIRVCLLTIKC